MATEDSDGDLRSGRSLHPSDHAVLGELHSGDDLVVNFEKTVSGEKAHLLGRSTGNDLQNDGGVVRHIELYANPVEIPREFGFGLLKILGREINRMGIQLGESRDYGGIGHAFHIHRIDIPLFDFLEDDIELLPGPGIDPCPGIRFYDAGDRQREDDSKHDSHQGHQ